MSSVTRFTRQISQGNTYYSAAAVIASPYTYVYELVPGAANVVGNYPSASAGSYMQNASAALQAALAQLLNVNLAPTLLLRDMGKTIQAPVGSTTGPSTFFRMVQVINPGAISYTQGVIGGASGTTFGVLGAVSTPDAYTNYLTFYIPVAVAAVSGLTVTPAAIPLHIASGSM
jgi:hypothetical protein